MRFSVVIPAKDEEGTIGACLDSLALCGAMEDIEVLVVDNGSRDRTPSIAAARGARVLNAPGATIAALRNMGAHAARGEVLAFLDADCTVEKGWLGAAAPYLEREEVVCFGSPPRPPAGASWVPKAWFLVRGKGEGEGEAQVAWLESMNLFVKRAPFLAVGGFDERLVTCEDYDLSLRLGRLGKIVSDGRIAAVHHGEAASLPEFFRKEYWRGTSNVAGFLSHGAPLSELPSVALPLISLLAALALPLLTLCGLLRGDRFLAGAAAALLIGWQLPLLLLAARKGRRVTSTRGILELYLLLNVYFLARGAALVRAR